MVDLRLGSMRLKSCRIISSDQAALTQCWVHVDEKTPGGRVQHANRVVGARDSAEESETAATSALRRVSHHRAHPMLAQ